tara:strand:+ start:9641 stop:10144 length:504 start_codon:yes stop_codon:yes gene_type:complete
MNKKEFLQRAKAINVKESRGHDAPSCEWDIKFDNVKVCECWDDSYGGELDINNLPNQSIEDIYNQIDKESLWDEEYQWTTTLELLMYELKNIAIMKKDEKKGVMIGKTTISNNPYLYDIVGYKTSIPTTFKRWNDSKKAYQKIIDDAIKEGKEILNKEYLSTWGLKV